MYIVYHVASTMKENSFKTLGAAKRSCTAKNKKSKVGLYAVADSDTYYNKIVHKVKVRNLMTGEEMEIDSNTPNCCNPASETYWSM